ncbi:MAG: hypothetical protein M0R03_20740, partial [Novosphingobium sp.]|nr:hypothetical protein [Novosphingobium sp.]
MKNNKVKHESYGMISISKFTGNKSQFFGSDLIHNGGVNITISGASKERKLSREWYSSEETLIKVNLSYNQFVDAITSGMNTSGVPCTVEYVNGKRIEQIDHIEDKKNVFKNEMINTQNEYGKRIEDILNKLDGNIGKRKVNEIKHDLEILKSHISSNTNFVVDSFNKTMEK